MRYRVTLDYILPCFLWIACACEIILNAAMGDSTINNKNYYKERSQNVNTYIMNGIKMVLIHENLKDYNFS